MKCQSSLASLSSIYCPEAFLIIFVSNQITRFMVLLWRHAELSLSWHPIVHSPLIFKTVCRTSLLGLMIVNHHRWCWCLRANKCHCSWLLLGTCYSPPMTSLQPSLLDDFGFPDWYQQSWQQTVGKLFSTSILDRSPIPTSTFIDHILTNINHVKRACSFADDHQPWLSSIASNWPLLRIINQIINHACWSPINDQTSLCWEVHPSILEVLAMTKSDILIFPDSRPLIIVKH